MNRIYQFGIIVIFFVIYFMSCTLNISDTFYDNKDFKENLDSYLNDADTIGVLNKFTGVCTTLQSFFILYITVFNWVMGYRLFHYSFKQKTPTFRFPTIISKNKFI